MSNLNLFETAHVTSAIVPVDLQGAQDGDWVSLKGYAGCNVIVFKAAGTAGDDPDISFEQATNVAGGSAKALNAIDRVYVKQGTLTSVDEFTVVTQTADDAYDADGTSAESQAIYGFYIDVSRLDVNNGFDCVRVRIADVGGNAQLGCALYVLTGGRYMGREGGISAIVN